MRKVLIISSICVGCIYAFTFAGLLLSAIGCEAIETRVAPTSTVSARKAAPTVNMVFNCRDAGDGDPFNARLFGDIWYFASNTPDQEIYNFFGDPNRSDDWNPKPTKPDATRFVKNEVSAGNYRARPGTFTKTLKAGYKIAIVWNFLDANPRARASYRHPLCIYYPTTDAQVKATIWTDQFRAGL